MPLIDQLRQRLRSQADRTDTSGATDRAFPPATPEHIHRAEDCLGFRLPMLLRDIYLGVGNGGFGPGCGLLGIEGGHSFRSGGERYDAVSLYQAFRQRREPRGSAWEHGLLPICHWGCCYFSYIECTHPAAPVFAFSEDNHGHGPWGRAFGLHAASFDEWMQRWANGENLWETFNAIGEPIFWFEENPATG